MKKTECEHRNAIEDGYFECYHCPDCQQYVNAIDIHFDTYGQFHDEESCPTVLSVGEEEIHNELFYGLHMSSTDFLGHTDSCYMNLTEEQVVELHNLLGKHLANLHNKEMKKIKKDYLESWIKDDE
ncbi:gp60 [Bacillus phage W.Ph.]|uniref:Gp60 n=1 Tax=Bacillus phage W.Ph. TaxID=764595 RepID=G9B1G1_9CAUD|nr:gp60 [Bacillus phage W.Ph.]ADH03206.1 gp60 [Bacillus phage W.Ph.]